MWPEVPPAEPYDQSIQELTGRRPYKGTLMYYHQFGIQDPYEAEEAPEPPPGQRTSDLVYYLEQRHHEHQTARHKPAHTLLGQRLQTHIDKDTSYRPHSRPRSGKQRQKPPTHSRELIGPPRPGRATELFQQGRVRADHHVVDDTNVCPVPPRSQYRPGPKFTLKKSPWIAAAESYIGDPREAFEENRPPLVERLSRQPPLKAKPKAPRERALAGVAEMDYARPPQRGGGHFNPHHQQQPFKTSTSWKGGPQAPQSGTGFKRFHANVVPYETDFNRKAKGWSSNYVHEDPTDPIFRQPDLDAHQSPSFHGSSGGPPQQQYGDYNPRPQTWQSQGQHGQEEDEEPYIPYDQKRSMFEQHDQQQYYHQPQQQKYHQPQHQHGRSQHPQRKAPPHAPKPGRGSSAPRQNYAGPQQQTWSGGLMESDDL